jgi:hypothetical protein
VQNDHFDPHGFVGGAALGVGALAFAAMASMQSAAQEIRCIAAERDEAARWDALEEMMEAQLQRFAEMKTIIAQQDQLIGELTSNVAELLRQLIR